VPPIVTLQRTVDVRPPDDPLPIIGQINAEFVPTARRFLERGFRVYIGWVHGQPVGYIWVHDATVTEAHPSLDRFGIRLRRNEAYLFNFYISPQSRGGGVAGAFLGIVLLRLQESGYERAYGYVDWKNIAARWTYTSSGWKTIYRIKGSVLGGTIMRSNRGWFLSTSLLRQIDRHYERVVPEFLPFGRARYHHLSEGSRDCGP
jgi:GNAT superfamily N-acetyltransferase